MEFPKTTQQIQKKMTHDFNLTNDDFDFITHFYISNADFYIV
jgi:hypothetical protein